MAEPLSISLKIIGNFRIACYQCMHCYQYKRTNSAKFNKMQIKNVRSVLDVHYQ